MDAAVDPILQGTMKPKIAGRFLRVDDLVRAESTSTD